MSQKNAIFVLTAIASGVIVGERFIKADGSQAGVGERTLGVAHYNAAAAEAVPVDVLGTTIVEAGAAVALDAQIESDASGRAITRVAGAIVGKALEAAGAAGEKIEVLLIAN